MLGDPLCPDLRLNHRRLFVKCIYSLLPLLVSGGVTFAQTTVSAVVNAASNAIPGLPNSSIAEGSMFVGYGANMGPASLVQASSYPLPTNLSGTSVKVAVGGTSVDAIMIYASATQFAAVLPSSAPVGGGTITVTYNGQTSTPAAISVVQNSFGTFAVNQAGSGAGIVTFADNTLAGLGKAANPGETLVIWGTGLGPVKGNEAAGPLPGDQTSIPVEVYIGGKQAAVSYRGRSGCCTGLDQIAFVVPAGVESCNVPVVVKIGNTVSNFTSIAVASSGRTCVSTSGTDLPTIFSKPNLTIGQVSLTRSTTQSSGIGGVGAGIKKSDDGSAVFLKLKFPTGGFPVSLVDSVSFGACTVTTFSTTSQSILGDFSFQGLDAGPSISINGPGGTRSITQETSPGLAGYYSAMLGDASPGNHLDVGKYTITGSGGADVGAFTTSVNVPQPLLWTNQAALGTVNRASGVQVTWSGGDPSAYVDIGGSSFALLSGDKFLGATFTCRARVSDGSFTVPPVVLLSLPVSSSLSNFAFSVLSVGTSTAPQQFTASGIDYGFVTSSVSNLRDVSYQ